MTDTFRVPASIEDATSKLASLDALVTAKQWQRAAIVYAFVTEAEGPGKPKSNSGLLSCAEFAQLGPDGKGIAGLRSKNTVRFYRPHAF